MPVRAVLAVYAEENGQRMFFDIENEEDTDWSDTTVAQDPEPIVTNGKEKRRSHLTLVE